MLLVGTCKKCGTEIRLDIGDKTIEEVIEQLRKRESFECPGHHFEIGPPYPKYWEVDKWELVEGRAPTEEEFLKELKKKYKEVLTTEEFRKRGILVGFAHGIPITNDGHSWDFVTSPAGKRYYVRR